MLININEKQRLKNNMGCIVRNKHKFYKKTLIDLWGHHYRYLKISKAINFMRVIKAEGKARYWYYRREFVFTYRRRKRFRRAKRFKEDFISRRYLRNFYLVLTYKNLRRYMDLANRKVGYYYGNYFTILEGRIFMMAYRSTFITNIFLIRYVIDKGLFTVNGIVRRHYNFVVNPGDIFQVSFDYKDLIRKDLLMRLDNNNIFYKVPNYLFANFNFMFVFFWRFPKLKDLVYPIALDLQVGAEYFYP